MRMRLNHLQTLGIAALGVAALGFLGCSGAAGTSTSTTASKLVYTNPTSASYRLVQDTATSTATHLVLNLVGPTGAQVQGGVFTLSADTAKASWASAGGSDAYVLEGGALSLGTGVKLLKSQVSSDALNVAIFQKGATAATLSSTPLFSVALDLKTATKGAITLASSSAKVLDATGTTVTVPVTVGTLTAE